MLKKSLIILATALAALSVQAQAPQSSPAKKELVARILKQQQPAIENMGRSLAEQPAVELMDNAANALPARVPQDRQDAVGKQIRADIDAYLNEAVPLVQGSAVKLAPSTVGPMLEEKFTEDELRQLVGIIESPVYAKFQRLGDDMQKALAEKVIADTRGAIEPKVRALEQTVAKRLGVGTAPAGAAARAPAKPAAKPPAK